MAKETEYMNALRALGQREAEDEFTVRLGDTTFRIHYYPGSSSHVMIETPYIGRRTPTASADYRGLGRGAAAIRPMELVLRKETSRDARAKRSGVSVEAQVDDPDFDDAVYIESPSRPEVIRHVLAAPEVRASVLAILGGGIEPVHIDRPGAVVGVRVDSFGPLPTDPRWLLDHLVTLATHLPEVQASGESHRADGWSGVQVLMGLGAVVGVVPALGLMLTMLPSRCYVSDGEGTSLACELEGCCTPLFGGLGLGLAVGLFAIALLSAVVRGTSDAHRRRPWLFFLALVMSIEASVSVAHLWGAVALH